MLGLLYQCCPCTKSIACPRFDFAPCLGNFRPQFSPKHTIRIDSIYRIIFAIRKHIATQKTPCIRRSICIRIDEPAVGKVVVPALEVIEAGLGVVVIAAVAQWVEVGDAGGIGEDFRTAVIHRAVAPGVIVVGRSEFAARIEDGGHIALRVEDVVIELRCLAVLVDHGERLVAVVIDELEGVIVTPSLPHDLAGERGVGVGRIADLLAAADTGHIVGVGNVLAVDRRGGKLPSLRPREGIVPAVVVRDRVAGGREVARLALAFVEDVLRRAAGRDAREQVRPRGVRVAEGLCDRAVFRNIPDVARRVVGIAEGRAAAVDLGRKLTQRVVGILLRQRRLGHVRAFGHDLRDVAGRIVGIGEAAKVRTALLVFQPS